MNKTIRAVFDGRVFRPEDSVDLEAGTHYVLTVEPEASRSLAAGEAVYPLTAISEMAVDMGVNDLSTRHSWYARGQIEECERDT